MLWSQLWISSFPPSLSSQASAPIIILIYYIFTRTFFEISSFVDLPLQNVLFYCPLTWFLSIWKNMDCIWFWTLDLPSTENRKIFFFHKWWSKVMTKNRVFWFFFVCLFGGFFPYVCFGDKPGCHLTTLFFCVSVDTYSGDHFAEINTKLNRADIWKYCTAQADKELRKLTCN